MIVSTIHKHYKIYKENTVDKNTVETGLIVHALMGSIAELYIPLYSRMHLYSKQATLTGSIMYTVHFTVHCYKNIHIDQELKSTSSIMSQAR